jgi:hypothetical protein
MMTCSPVRDAAHKARGFALALACMLALVSPQAAAHDDGRAAPTTSAPASPRATAVSENYQFVGIVEGDELVIYLDRFADNQPVTTAKLEVTVDGTSAVAELRENGTYEIASPLLKTPGTHEVLISIADGDINDLLVSALTVPAPGVHGHEFDHSIWTHVAALGHAHGESGRNAAWIGGAGLGVIGLGLLLARRRRVLATLFLFLSIAIVGTTAAFAHSGHDHEAGASLNGSAPQRLPSGQIFLPKPTQRLLEVRTRVLQTESLRQAVRFVGRVIPNPNRSGVVQSTVAGRYLPPTSGVASIGATVKAGDIMGTVAPSFIAKDASDMTQTLGELEQQIALARSKLSRQASLLEKKVVAEAAVEEIRIQLAGLLGRRKELLSAKVEPEELRASVDGVLTAVRVVAGQVVSQSDVLFEIVDPRSLMVEALAFDQSHADKIVDAVSSTSDNVRSRLRFVGRNRALQQQYSVLRFEVLDPSPDLDIGTPVTVTGHAGEPLNGIVLPRAAIAQAPNGQMVVFRHVEPEMFEPRAVRFEPFGADSVRITAGVEPGDKVVVQGAPLVNQVR